MASVVKVIAKIFLQFFCLDINAVDLPDCVLEFFLHRGQQFGILGVLVEPEPAPCDRVNLLVSFWDFMQRVIFAK